MIRLYFEHFSVNQFLSGKGGNGYKSQELKHKLKNALLPQITLGSIRKIDPEYFPLAIVYTFVSTHDFDIDNYNLMAKYITDTLVFRKILPDDNQKIINEYRVSVVHTDKKTDEGCIVRFIPNNKICE